MRDLNKNEKFGLYFTSAVHLLLIILALLWYTERDEESRLAFIEVNLGEFSDGTLAEFSEERNPDVATRRNPPRVETPRPQPLQQPVEQPRQREQEPAKPVELPEQIEVVVEEVVSTPETEKIDPIVLTQSVEVVEQQVDQKTRQDEIEREGPVRSGDERGVRGDVDVDQGTGLDPVRSAPFVLAWDGDISRSPLVQPMPNYVVEVDAIIIMRFEVRPDGTVGSIQPLRRSSPELEAEVTRTLRSWRFNQLPASLPQNSQWGTITFRFVLN